MKTGLQRTAVVCQWAGPDTGEHKGAAFHFISTYVHIHLSGDIYIRLSRPDGGWGSVQKNPEKNCTSPFEIYAKKFNHEHTLKILTESLLDLITDTILHTQLRRMPFQLSIMLLSLIWPIYLCLRSWMSHSVLKCREEGASRDAGNHNSPQRLKSAAHSHTDGCSSTTVQPTALSFSSFKTPHSIFNQDLRRTGVHSAT